MNSIFSFLILSLFLVAISFGEQGICPRPDTSIQNFDTLIVKYTCYKSGKIDWKKSYRNGKSHGLWESWYEDGKIKSRGKVVNGKSDSVHEAWDSTGFRISYKTYRHGKAVGRHEEWYAPGKRKRIVHFNDKGQEHGLRESWTVEGLREDSLVCVNDVIVESRIYFDNGKIMAYRAKMKNTQILDATFYAPNGTISGVLRNGNGKFIRYDMYGKGKSELVYEDGWKMSDKEIP